ncbi:MAG: hypothetical protein JXP48_11010 [Acidobacteria bacterium]|nr:hypothetical protein [Acidobacteriota bacterium]
MRKSVLIALLVLCSPLVLKAQDTPKAEVFGGYQYLYFEEEGMNGVTAAVEGNVHPNIGIVGEFGLATKSFPGDERFTPVTFMGGPRFSYRGDKFRVFGHALAGGFRYAVSQGDASVSEVYFATTLGGGLDVSLSDRISIRPAQVDLINLRVTYEDESNWYGELRYSAGIVFKFGKR